MNLDILSNYKWGALSSVSYIRHTLCHVTRETTLKNMYENLRDIFDIEFENRIQHRKGMNTEDSVLRATRAVCKSLSIGILMRIMPPRAAGIGECDAVIFSDIGLLIIEAKRFGGEIESLDLQSDTIRIRKGQEVKVDRNPAKQIAEKAQKLKRFIDLSRDWSWATRLFNMAGLKEGVPVFPVLSFGPSTKILKDMPENPYFLVCNSRTIRRNLKSFIAVHPYVLGISKLMRFFTNNWLSVGKLTVLGKGGFLRAYPKRAEGVIVSFTDIVSIEGTKNGSMKLLYADNIKRTTKEIKALIFHVNVDDKWEDVILKPTRQFKWTCAG